MNSEDPQFQCAFCGQAIIVLGPDPGRLAYTPHNPEGLTGAITQDLYCHAACLAACVHGNVPLYAMDLVEPPES